MKTNVEIEVIQSKIFEVRGKRVMLDYHLAVLYQIENRALKQAVRRNIEHFPSDFMFELTKEESERIISQGVSQNVIPLGYNIGSARFMAFTELGVAMLSSVLRSKVAIEVNISIMRAFVALRQMLVDYDELKQRINELELSTNSQFSELYKVLTQLFEKKSKPRKAIGYVTTDNDE